MNRIPGSVSIDGALRSIGDSSCLTVGSAPDNDIVVDHHLVSGHHLRIEWRGEGWWAGCVDRDAVVVTAGRAVTDLPITSSARLHLGNAASGPVLVVALDDDCWRPLADIGDSHSDMAFQTIGRTSGNDIVVDDMLASRHHARLSGHPGGLLIEDVGSSNGTYLDGRRIDRSLLTDGAVVTIGNTDFHVRGGALVRSRAPRAIVADGLSVRGVGLTVDGGKELLHDVDFSARPGTLTAVIGPSGAGKSTVSKVVAGLVTPTAGQVTFAGHDVHAEYDALRTRIGMVPQQDVLHHKLTLRQALRFAAELRLPPDLSTADRDAVIADVLGELQLLEHLDTRVDTLSGGQRKRASVAMELLTGPSLLILDEPTSGLDPALDRQVMSALRRLADAGRVVLVVTHSLTYLTMCDQVLLLAPGGKTAFAGPPDRVPEALGTHDWAEIFAHVAAHPDSAHREHLRRNGRRASTPPTRRPAGRATAAPQTTALRQCSTVARRQVRLILADRGYLAFLAAMPVVLGLLTLVIPGSRGFGVNDVADTAGEALQILVILVIGAGFMGTALTVRDLVGERDIFERERAVGLRPGAYLAAKIAVFFAATTLQVAVMVTITYVGKGVPTGGVAGSAPVELFLALAVLACVGALVGLVISASVRSTEQTMPPLVIIVISQLVFCGGLFRLTTPGLAQLSWVFPSYWGYAGAASAVDLNRISPLAPQTAGAMLWEPGALNSTLSFSALLLIATVLVSYTVGRLSSR
ncbi:ATP-binding cassette domain-containing protein [Gordonia insulae]|uniref:ABC transporter ATP-binding/permease protein n=1 Tax=Gordonia insulae TaxID=2420509 RepID=A0A3G8JQS9_9ACTN|nr:ATP-binding cassette domain-containing protein [Gordonia insulae]AZG46869.1 ABC transporter ATP-binding/permease protein [Gordonia insulae]